MGPIEAADGHVYLIGVQQADIFRIGLAELERRYPPEQPQKRSKQ